MPKIVELRQDRSLICSNFDGYKLSLDAVPLIRQELPSGPYKAEANDDQYSLLHAELFAMQNLLQADPWARTSAYFVNRLGEIVRCRYDENVGRPDTLKVVCRLSEASSRRSKGDYNYSFRFVSEKYCVLCDGKRGLLLFDTGDRIKSPEWKEVAKTEVPTGGDVAVERNFMLYDCRLDTIQEQRQISLAVGRVHREEGADGESTSHYLHLHWAKWILKGSWEFSVLDTLEGKGSLYYCAFEPRAESLILSSNREFQYRSQKSTAAAAAPAEKGEHEERPHLHNGSDEITGLTWTQTDDDVVIKFDAKENKTKADYKVTSTADKLAVQCVEEVLLDRALSCKIDPELTTWTIDENSLQVTLIKQSTPEYWPSLLADGAGPQETLDSAKPNCVPVEQQPIANLEAPIEDCDFPIGTVEDEVQINRFHLPTKTITHTVLLGSNPPLFTTSLRPGFPSAFATRQDVDACLWLQQYSPSKPEEWALRHEGNLHAFGYVQASKQQRKFMDCSPDMSYALICESHRHIFLYKGNYDGAGGLRKRGGPPITLGKQHLIALEEAGEVLGLSTAPSVVVLLTENFVLYLQVN